MIFLQEGYRQRPINLLPGSSMILPQISIINKIELLGFTRVPTEIVTFTESVFVINLDDDIVAKTILLRKGNKIKLPDAIIAATALVLNLTVVTNNIDDFKNIEGLQLLNPYNFS